MAITKLEALKQNNPYIQDLDHKFSQEIKRLLVHHKNDFDLNLKIKTAAYEFINKLIESK